MSELDYEVAEKVLGWKRFDTFRDQAGKIPLVEWFRPGHQHATSRTPAFSTDAAAAWQVVERMLEIGYPVQIEHGEDSWSLWTADFGSVQGSSYAVTESTMPLAVCRAALAILAAMDAVL